MSMQHADWHLPVSMTTFAEQYAAALPELAADGMAVTLERGDYGVEVNCSVLVVPNVDLYLAFKQVADDCLRKYRE